LDEDHSTRVIRVWNLDSREQAAVFPQPGVGFTGCLHFRPSGALLCSDESGLTEWNIQTGENEQLFERAVTRFAVSADDTIALLQASDDYTGGGLNLGEAVVLDLRDRSTSTLVSHGNELTAVAMDAGGTMAITGDDQGVIRVGPISGEEPHLLLGSPNKISDLAVDPRGRWIASASGKEVRLWPMPDLSKPPLHTLPREELIAKLKTLTNLRVVRDEESPTGWKLTHDPFPGWETVPTW
jgi:WD40 repeat protein